MESAPNEIRTRVLALRGLRPGPLDNGGARAVHILCKREGFYHVGRGVSIIPRKLSAELEK